MRTLPQQSQGRRACWPRTATLSVMPDQMAARDLGLSYWDDDVLGIIAKGYLASGAETAQANQSREVQP